MSDQDLFKAFKESSETDRDFDFKSSGWYKVNRLLNQDDQRKRRKWLLFLPWALAGSMLGFCVFLFQSQSDSNNRLKELIAQMNQARTAMADTVVRTKYIYIHDTIVSRQIIYVESASLNKNAINNSSVYAGSSSSSTTEETSTVQNTGNIFTNKNPAAISDNNSIEEVTTYNKTLKGTGKFENVIQSKTNDVIIKRERDSVGISEFRQETKMDDTNDSFVHINTTTASGSAELTDKKDEKKEKLKYGMVSESGVYGGVLIPMQKNVFYQLGYNVGLGYNLFLSPDFQLQVKGAYSHLRFETNQFNSTIGVPFKESPNAGAGYVFESATSSLSSLNVEMGVAYILPLKYTFKPFIGFAYGGRYVLPYKANYTFYNNINEDIVVEAESKLRFFLWNNIIPSVGLCKTFNDKWNWYLTGFYNYSGANITAAPGYFGLNTSFYYKF